MNYDFSPRERGSRTWFTPDGLHLDVRGLDPPEPMVAILGLIDGGEAGNAMTVHLDREPIFLYPELEARGWSYEMLPGIWDEAACDDEVNVRLVRMPT
jgi:uncharacterized protein (DUF2249 family)